MTLNKNLLLVLLSSSLLTVSASASYLFPRDNAVVQGVLASNNSWDDSESVSRNNYTFYSGDGSAAAGWPQASSWISFNDMWMNNQRIMQRSCDIYYNQSNNSGQEMTDLFYAIKRAAKETQVDHRLILAAVMQETKGCVRASTSVSQDGIHNPGILQDFKGTHSCNDNGKVQTPCPQEQILGMIMDGIGGTAAGHGWAQDINDQGQVSEKPQAFYRAARLYNSGAIDASGDLGKGSATHCYASDIANRMTGWVDADTKCTLDKDNGNAHQ